VATPASLVNTAHRGGFFHPAWELRITQRCLSEDLGVDVRTPFEDLCKHEIVKALISDRARTPEGGKTVGPQAGDKTLYRLGYGDDHRGATWYDRDHDVVWLCAYHGRHRSGDPDDAIPYFDRLIAERRIRPQEEDFAALFEERDAWFVDLAPSEAQALLAAARENPGEEQSGMVGGEALVGVVVEVVEILSETYVAFYVGEIGYARFVILLAAFYPGAQFTDWIESDSFPTRSLREGEVCYHIPR
jgi:hypothetical protein